MRQFRITEVDNMNVILVVCFAFAVPFFNVSHSTIYRPFYEQRDVLKVNRDAEFLLLGSNYFFQ